MNHNLLKTTILLVSSFFSMIAYSQQVKNSAGETGSPVSVGTEDTSTQYWENLQGNWTLNTQAGSDRGHFSLRFMDSLTYTKWRGYQPFRMDKDTLFLPLFLNCKKCAYKIYRAGLDTLFYSELEKGELKEVVAPYEKMVIKKLTKDELVLWRQTGEPYQKSKELHYYKENLPSVNSLNVKRICFYGIYDVFKPIETLHALEIFSDGRVNYFGQNQGNYAGGYSGEITKKYVELMEKEINSSDRWEAAPKTNNDLYGGVILYLEDGSQKYYFPGYVDWTDFESFAERLEGMQKLANLKPDPFVKEDQFAEIRTIYQKLIKELEQGR